MINLFVKGNMELTKLSLIATNYFISFMNIVASVLHISIEKLFESALISILGSLVFVLIFFYLYFLIF